MTVILLITLLTKFLHKADISYIRVFFSIYVTNVEKFIPQIFQSGDGVIMAVFLLIICIET